MNDKKMEFKVQCKPNKLLEEISKAYLNKNLPGLETAKKPEKKIKD